MDAQEISILNTAIKRYSTEKAANFFFLQIGSNDGKTGDPIYKYVKRYHWKGVLVEPVPYIFNKLRDNYKNSKGLIFENVAIAHRNGYRIFYRIKKNSEPNNPYWYDQLGSFNKRVVLKHRDRIPNFDTYLSKEKIKCISFKKLLLKHKIKKIDLLHIDTEGYDYEIIKLIPFDHLKPAMILYEHTHLSPLDTKKCLALLKKLNYSIIPMRKDTLAYLVQHSAKQ